MIIPLDKTATLFDGSLSGSGVHTVNFIVEADTVLLSVYVRSVSAPVTVTCDAVTKPGERREIIAFAPIAAATSVLLFEIAAVALANCQLKIAYTGAVELQVVAKGLNLGSGDGATPGTTAPPESGAAQRVAIAVANVEQAVALTGIKQFTVINRLNLVLRLGFSVGSTATAYFTLYPNGAYSTPVLATTSPTLYLYSGSTTGVVELVTWS